MGSQPGAIGNLPGTIYDNIILLKFFTKCSQSQGWIQLISKWGGGGVTLDIPQLMGGGGGVGDIAPGKKYFFGKNIVHFL